MESKVLLGLAVCALIAGIAVGGISLMDAEAGHDEPKSILGGNLPTPVGGAWTTFTGNAVVVFGPSWMASG